MIKIIDNNNENEVDKNENENENKESKHKKKKRKKRNKRRKTVEIDSKQNEIGLNENDKNVINNNIYINIFKVKSIREIQLIFQERVNQYKNQKIS